MAKTENNFFNNNYVKLGEVLKRRYTDDEIKDIYDMFAFYFDGVNQNKYVGFLTNYDYMPNYKTALRHYCKVGDLLNIKKLQVIMNDSLDNIDLFFAVNPLAGTCGLNEKYISSFTIISVDIDFYTKEKYEDFTPEDMLEILKNEAFGIKVPMPSAVQFTGNGMHIIWRLENYYHICSPKNDTGKGELVHVIRDNEIIHIVGDKNLQTFFENNKVIKDKCKANKNMIYQSRRYSNNLDIIKKIKERFTIHLKSYGAEGGERLHKDRVIHTTNSKNGEKVKFVKLNDYKYSVNELVSWCGELYSERNVIDKGNITEKKGKGNPKFTFKSYREKVLKDLEVIQEFANEIGDNLDGYKYYMCWIYRCIATELYGPEEALEAMIEFNRNYLEPRDEEKNNSQTASAFYPHLYTYANGKSSERSSYWLPTALIREMLDLDRFIDIEHKLNILISDNEKEKRKAERNRTYYENVTKPKIQSGSKDENGKTVKQQEKIELTKKIIEMHKNGLTPKEIAELSEVHIATVYRYLKKVAA